MTPTLSSTLPGSRAADVRALLVAHAATTTAGTEPAGTEPAATGWRARRPRLVLGAALTVAAGLTAAALLVGGPATPPAYASWAAVPRTAAAEHPSSGDLRQWSSRCTDLGVGGVSVQGVPPRPAAAAARKVLVDRRGDFTFCVDVTPGAGTSTDPLIALAGLRADGGREKGLNRMWSTVSDERFRQPTGPDLVVLGGDLRTPPATDAGVVSLNAYQLYGVVGEAVTGVDVVLTNGLRVTATVSNGLWGAWWPVSKGDPTGSRLAVHTATSTRTLDPDLVQLQQHGS